MISPVSINTSQSVAAMPPAVKDVSISARLAFPEAQQLETTRSCKTLEFLESSTRCDPALLGNTASGEPPPQPSLQYMGVVAPSIFSLTQQMSELAMAAAAKTAELDRREKELNARECALKHREQLVQRAEMQQKIHKSSDEGACEGCPVPVRKGGTRVFHVVVEDDPECLA
eukprot:jgi/Mesvir1/11751/Mv00122-RA.1